MKYGVSTGWLLLLAASLFSAPLPVFLSGPSDEEPERIARDYLDAQVDNKPTLRLLRRWRDAHNGLNHFIFQQELHGLPVFGDHLCVHVTRRGQLVSCHGELRHLEGLPAAGWTAAQARDSARAALHLPVGDEVAAELMVFFPASEAPCLVWNMQVHAPDGSAALNVNVDAASGKVIWQNDLVRRCTHRVFAPPLESPDHGLQTLVQHAPDPVASPFGWHDTNGVAGPEFTDTRGNNTQVQEDGDANNIGGLRPDGGPSLAFDIPFDPSLVVSGNRDAAMVNVFFWANYLHDVLYHYGFDEASGNFQANNYGHSGTAGDPVLLDIQDGASVNNATFTASSDGIPGRMQLHIWINGAVTVSVSAPAAIVGLLQGNGAQFGGSIPPGGLSHEVVLARDAADPPLNSTTDACSVITNVAEVTGKIALIDRGDCLFTDKVKRAQDAGAIAVIIANHEGEGLVRMAGSDATIVIPSVFIRQSAGEVLKAQLALGETIEVTINGSPERDAALDNGIIAHEYAHGVTSRLTGGPANPNCLSIVNRQSVGLSEGWSDFFGLVFTQEPGDVRQTQRSVGAYVLGDITGPGIRSLPYAADLSINPLTFNDLLNVSDSHQIGEVWCLALWELYWDFIDRYGYDPDLVHGQGGNNRCLQLVLDALKLQPCNPTFTDARDAILLADQVNHAGAYQCLIWRAFGRRGLGQLASAGAATATVVNEDFSVPLGCEVDIDLTLHPPTGVPFQMDWPAVSGAVYQVQQRFMFDSGAWVDLPDGRVTATLQNVVFDLPTTAPTQLYYRVQLELDP
jgi:hypothetical protein